MGLCALAVPPASSQPVTVMLPGKTGKRRMGSEQSTSQPHAPAHPQSPDRLVLLQFAQPFAVNRMGGSPPVPTVYVWARTYDAEPLMEATTVARANSQFTFMKNVSLQPSKAATKRSWPAVRSGSAKTRRSRRLDLPKRLSAVLTRAPNSTPCDSGIRVRTSMPPASKLEPSLPGNPTIVFRTKVLLQAA